MTNTYMNRKSLVWPLNRVAVLMISLLLMILPSIVRAQNADVGPSIQPSSRVRLTGMLEPVRDSYVSTFPQIRVLIGGTPWLLHVCQIEPLIPAYPAEQELRKVSGWGLRLLTDNDELVALQRPEMHERPIVIEGQLRVRAGLLQVSTIYTAELAAEQCLSPTIG